MSVTHTRLQRISGRMDSEGGRCVPGTFPARRWRNFQKICNRNTQRWPAVLRRRMCHTLYALCAMCYVVCAVWHRGLMRHPSEANWKYLKTTAPAGSRHSLAAQNRFYTGKKAKLGYTKLIIKLSSINFDLCLFCLCLDLTINFIPKISYDHQ